MTEAEARVRIDAALKSAGWRLPDAANPNVRMERGTIGGGFADYVLLGDNNYPLVVLEAKNPGKHPLEGKEQARRYAEEQNAPFVILSNGMQHYFWDVAAGEPETVQSMPSPQSVARRKERRAPSPITSASVNEDYIADSQKEGRAKRKLRDYQINAVRAVQQAAANGKNRFLLEMATGTGKTMIAAALIKMFMRTGNAARVLFLVDRLELEEQARKNFDDYLAADYRAVVFKQSRSDWNKAHIVVSTVQSLAVGKRFLGISPLDFDLLIVDEAHRCIAGKNSRAVFEHFLGRKIGLTATPHDFMKGVDAAKENSKAVEARLMRDTYDTFDCKAHTPTFRYNLEDGAESGHLLRPNVLDARTEITTDLLSEQGFDIAVRDEQTGEEKEMTFHRADFERKLFSEKTNKSFCRAFMDRALRDPVSGEIGKTIVYCVSQRHAAKITAILNKMARERFAGKYDSDFAVQITSNQAEAQENSRRFANNNLNGTTRFLDDYASSRTRVCVTVEMMTTGYDCPDLLNLCFARPVFSPSLFVQIKGRGTRKHAFSFDRGKGDKLEQDKDKFLIFDFFAVCEYFEKDFNYDDKLPLPSGEDDNDDNAEDKPPPEEREGAAVLTRPDPIKTITETEGATFHIDEPPFKRFVDQLRGSDSVRNAAEDENWAVAVAQAREKYEDKPDDYATPEKIARDNKLGRQLQTREVLEYAFGLINKFKTRPELLEEEALHFAAVSKLPPEETRIAADALKAYISNRKVREIINSGKIGKLMGESSLSPDDWNSLSKETREAVVHYANSQTALEVFDKKPAG